VFGCALRDPWDTEEVTLPPDEVRRIEARFDALVAEEQAA
jgi:hypothetical protein